MRNIWNSWSINRRILALIILPILTMYALIFAYQSYTNRKLIEDDLRERGAFVSKTFSRNAGIAILMHDFTDVQEAAARYARSSVDIAMIEIRDSQGNVLFSFKKNPLPGGTFHPYDAEVIVDISSDDVLQNSPKLIAAFKNQYGAAITKARVGSVRAYLTDLPVKNRQTNDLLAWTAITACSLLLAAGSGILLSRTITTPLKGVIDALRLMRHGEYKVEIEVTHYGQIGMLQSTINEMAANIDAYRNEMEQLVASRTANLKAEHELVVEANRTKTNLIRRLDTIAEEERKAISVEIHDQLNASLIGIRLEMQRIASTARNHLPASEVSQNIQNMADTAGKSVLDLYDLARVIVRRLRPETLDNLGLEASIVEMMSQYNRLYPDCKFTFSHNNNVDDVPNAIQLPIYRVIQEALSNVIKHAKATQCHVAMDLTNEGTTVKLTVEDNGQGIPETVQAGGVGLQGIRERIDGLDGSVTFISKPGNGTAVVAFIPLKSPDLH